MVGANVFANGNYWKIENATINTLVSKQRLADWRWDVC